MSANPNFDRVSYDSGYAAGLASGRAKLSATQQKLEAAEAENAELTRKLAEQQAHLDAALTQLQCACSYEEPQHVCEYHRKLLAEAKSKAVPEGWRLVHYAKMGLLYGRPVIHQLSAIQDDYFDTAIYAAAPQPETDRGSNE